MFEAIWQQFFCIYHTRWQSVLANDAKMLVFFRWAGLLNRNLFEF